MRLDRWLRRRWPHLRQGQIEKLARTGQIRVDGARAKADCRLTAGAMVRIPPLPPAPLAEVKNCLSLREREFAKSLVILEDEQVLVLDKPAGLAVQGGTGTHHHIDRLLAAWGEGPKRPRLTHRLDRDTSGVLILGKSAAAAASLAGAFARREAKKTYWALVAGVPDPTNGVIDWALTKTGDKRERMELARPAEPNALSAESRYATLAESTAGVAWLALRPLTGRTHQLRAHLLALGYPILGDTKYYNSLSKSLSRGLKLQLHAHRLIIPHPAGGVTDVEAPPSPEIADGFARFGFDPGCALRDPFEGLDLA